MTNEGSFRKAEDSVRQICAQRNTQSEPKYLPSCSIRHLSKKEAAKLHNNGEAVRNPTAYFNRLIEKGDLTPPRGSGKQWRYVIHEFPAGAHDKMR